MAFWRRKRGLERVATVGKVFELIRQNREDGTMLTGPMFQEVIGASIGLRHTVKKLQARIEALEKKET